MPTSDKLTQEQLIAERKANLHNRLLHLSTDRISEVSTDAAADIVLLRAEQLRIAKIRDPGYASQALDDLTSAVNTWQHNNFAT